LSRIDFWVRPKNNGKNQGDQISKNQMSNNEIKKIKDKKIAIKSIRTSFEKKKEMIVITNFGFPLELPFFF
jgi:hypothetical protein